MGRVSKMAVGLLLIFLFPIRSMALPGCLNPVYHDAFDRLVLFQKAAIICDKEGCNKDNRETFEEYASKPERKTTVEKVSEEFSATGRFHCDGMSTANVVRRNPNDPRKNLLVLNAHAFYKSNTCHPKFDGNFSKCYFEKIDRNGKVLDQYRIKPKTLKVGTKCPRDGTDATPGIDWAIVELNRDVEGVQPYDVVDVRQLGGKRGDDYEALLDLKTTTVSAQGENFYGHSLTTPSLCDDRLRAIQADIDPQTGQKIYFHATACSTGRGNSGSAVVIRRSDAAPALIGLVSDASQNTKDYLPFGPSNYAGGPLLEGLFYEALMQY